MKSFKVFIGLAESKEDMLNEPRNKKILKYKGNRYSIKSQGGDIVLFDNLTGAEKSLMDIRAGLENTSMYSDEYSLYIYWYMEGHDQMSLYVVNFDENQNPKSKNINAYETKYHSSQRGFLATSNVKSIPQRIRNMLSLDALDKI